MHPDALPLRLKYFTEKAIGGNLLTIYFGHLFDQVQYVLGEVQNLAGHVQIQRPEIKLTDESTHKVTEVVMSDVPDLIIAIGDFQGSESTVAGATLLARLRLGQPFPGEPQLARTIKGETGEIRLTAEGTTTLQAAGYDKPVRLEVHNFGSSSVEVVEWKWTE
ncbi:hypothetical protein NKR23_g8136 [Pleurostoma richardsiae]|uniref:Gal80p-like C-terminal domain-containing protein n=1 Tax=Pleurostoma richardsiae TaxID=41990 RepID=A0AA38R6X7_9PEZI|nr:hypothetical protein NKR23_g8136 [Pleurostoma richardsiae]